MGMSGAHHLTFSKNEVDSLLALGWKEGDPKFYGYPVPIEEKYDVLDDGQYNTDIPYTGASISDDMRLLTINTSWWHYGASYLDKIVDYEKKEYHIPISAECTVTSHGGMVPDIIMPLSEGIDHLRHILPDNYGSLGLSITVKNGEIVDFMISS